MWSENRNHLAKVMVEGLLLGLVYMNCANVPPSGVGSGSRVEHGGGCRKWQYPPADTPGDTATVARSRSVRSTRVSRKPGLLR